MCREEFNFDKENEEFNLSISFLELTKIDDYKTLNNLLQLEINKGKSNENDDSKRETNQSKM